MRKIYIILHFFIFQVSISQVNSKQNEKLIATCKVWGFLKYYHPKVASGNFDWNNQLVAFLPKIEETKTNTDFSNLIENWITSLGKVEKLSFDYENENINIKYFNKNFNLSWIDDTRLFSKSLSDKLRFIEKNRVQNQQYYVGVHHGGNIFVKNEDFTKFNPLDKNQRILALFTYWNIVEYFFPYKYLMDKKWDYTLKKILPCFMKAQNTDEFYLAFQKLTTQLNDSHTVFYKYKHKNHYLPIKAKIIDNKLIITEILNRELIDKYNIKVGEIITKINGKSIKSLIKENKQLISASNNSRYLFDIVEPILKGEQENIKLEFLINKKFVAKDINWVNYNSNKYVLTHRPNYNSKIDKFKIIENNVGYVNMGVLKNNEVAKMIDSLKNTKAIVFDLRNYPNGTLDAISSFLNSKEKEFVKYIFPDITYPGKFKWIENITCGFENKNNYKGKVFVLVNEESISQSEWTAMAFKTADNNIIIGSQTAGADGNITDIDYMPAFHSSFSGIGVYYPDKRETQRIGIVPDIVIKPTIKGIQKGFDEVLEYTLKFIKTRN